MLPTIYEHAPFDPPCPVLGDNTQVIRHNNDQCNYLMIALIVIVIIISIIIAYLLNFTPNLISFVVVTGSLIIALVGTYAIIYRPDSARLGALDYNNNDTMEYHIVICHDVE
jgi:uncharacterized MnhB-related membrane protein